YLPLFFDRTALITEYLPQDTVIVTQEGLHPAAEQFWSDTHARYSMLRGDHENPPLPPHDLFLTTDEFFGAIKPYARVELASTSEERPGPAEPGSSLVPHPSSLSEATAPTVTLPPLAVDRRAENPLHRLRAFVDSFPGRVLVLAESPGRRETLQDYLAEHGLAPAAVQGSAESRAATERLMLGVSPVHTGFILTGGDAVANEEPASGKALALITENELYAQQARIRRERDGGRRTTAEGMLRDLSE